MTDDLVKRLRSPANVFYEYAADNGAFLREAADRIEKLEMALRDLLDGWECCPVSQAMRRVARDALEGAQ
ncbi:hypothetical protein UFOVP62_36 [uncultured Caudovirales phage]|uniref:Uncharacterized protein n=1 Tax=uncultured Caudovirales phage TaxID=2100421 RepID=A0A6J5KR02_9CAUD|nr:hypothetical protein UFOVP62_36 [uncultured Caudovirales phage]